MIDMTRRLFIPAVIKYQTLLANSINEIHQIPADIDISVQEELLKKVSYLLKAADTEANKLEKMIIKTKKLPEGKMQAEEFNVKVAPVMLKLRENIDNLEVIVDKDYWPVPTYSDILFEV